MEPHAPDLASGAAAHGISGAGATRVTAVMDVAMGSATATRFPKNLICLSLTFPRTGCAGMELHALGRNMDRAARGGSGAEVGMNSVLEIVVLSLENVITCNDLDKVPFFRRFNISCFHSDS